MLLEAWSRMYLLNVFPVSLTFEITHAIVIGIHKTAGINLIEHRAVPPSPVEDLARGHSDRQQQTEKDNVVL